jgi:hypothetical protein
MGFLISTRLLQSAFKEGQKQQNEPLQPTRKFHRPSLILPISLHLCKRTKSFVFRRQQDGYICHLIERPLQAHILEIHTFSSLTAFEPQTGQRTKP